jgi:hypothetical protein
LNNLATVYHFNHAKNFAKRPVSLIYMRRTNRTTTKAEGGYPDAQGRLPLVHN